MANLGEMTRPTMGSWLRERARRWINWGSSAPMDVAQGDTVVAPYMGVEQKGFSLISMDTSRKTLRGAGPLPSDQGALRAYSESPWLNAKLVRVCSSIAMADFEFGTEDARGLFSPLPRSYPLWVLMRQPNPIMTGFDFRFLTMLYARVTGEAYWRVLRGGIAPVSLWLYPREWVSPIYSRDQTRVEAYKVRAKLVGGAIAKSDTVPASDMIWLRHPDPLDPYVRGVGEVLAVATELDTFELASESDRRFFENDAQPPGALIVPGTPTPAERQRILDDWHARVGGPEKAGSIPILSGGLDFKQFRQSRKEMDFIEGQVYLRDVIIRGVHKHILGISEDVNLASAKAAEFTYARWELMPDVVWLQENINQRLSPIFDARAQIRFKSPVPADEEFELMKANEGLTRGAMTRNEWRAAMGQTLLPSDKGNVFLMPIAVIETPVDSPPREEPSRVNPNPDPDDNDDRPRPPGDQGARSKGRKPIGPYASFAACVAANQDKDDPEAYCGAIEETVTSIDPVGPSRGPSRRGKQLTPEQMREIIDEVTDDAEFGKFLLGAYEAIISGRYADAAREIGAEPSLHGSSLLTQRYMAEEAATRVAGIGEHTRDALREALEESIRQGETLREVADRVSELYEGFKGDRAVLIARTETIDASRWTALETYKTNGVEGKEWLLAPDYDPGQDDGVCQEYEENGVVRIGEDFQGPEGPLDGPSAHPGCRCSVAPVVTEEGDEGEERSWRHFYADPARKSARITALGREHMRLERTFANVLRRAFQKQQNALLRRVRSA